MQEMLINLNIFGTVYYCLDSTPYPFSVQPSKRGDIGSQISPSPTHFHFLRINSPTEHALLLPPKSRRSAFSDSPMSLTPAGASDSALGLLADVAGQERDASVSSERRPRKRRRIAIACSSCRYRKSRV